MRSRKAGSTAQNTVQRQNWKDKSFRTYLACDGLLNCQLVYLQWRVVVLSTYLANGIGGHDDDAMNSKGI